jgi:flagellar motility protein MotE (MotC chaperone)
LKQLLKTLVIVSLLFLVFGLSGGTLFLVLIKNHMISEGRWSEDQIAHVKAILQMEPEHFQENVLKYLDKERKPINEREEDLFAERKRLEQERSNFLSNKMLWMEQLEEERTRLRADRMTLANERRQLDGLKDDIDSREKIVKSRENAIRSKGYRQWLDMLRKMKPDAIGSLMVNRSATEIVQDLNQLKPQTAGEVVLYLHAYKDRLKDERDREAFSIKINDIIDLARDGGLRFSKIQSR